MEKAKWCVETLFLPSPGLSLSWEDPLVGSSIIIKDPQLIWGQYSCCRHIAEGDTNDLWKTSVQMQVLSGCWGHSLNIYLLVNPSLPPASLACSLVNLGKQSSTGPGLMAANAAVHKIPGSLIPQGLGRLLRGWMHGAPPALGTTSPFKLCLLVSCSAKPHWLCFTAEPEHWTG